MFRKLHFLLIVSAITVISCNARTIKILAIGNSFSEDAIEQNLYEIASAAGDTAIIGNLYIGGCELEKHAHNAIYDAPAYRYRKIGADGNRVQTDRTTIRQALADDTWDVVTLQQASHYSGLPESYTPWINMLVSFVRENTDYDPLIGFHQTWAYASASDHWAFVYYGYNQADMYRRICSAARQAMTASGISLVIPAGTAIQNCRTSYIGDNLNRDGFHLDLKLGRYLAACTWYESLFGSDVQGNHFLPEGVDKNDAATAQRAAHAAVTSPWQVTPIK